MLLLKVRTEVIHAARSNPKHSCYEVHSCTQDTKSLYKTAAYIHGQLLKHSVVVSTLLFFMALGCVANGIIHDIVGIVKNMYNMP